MKPWKRYYFHKFTMSFCYGKDVTEMQSLGLYQAVELEEEGFNVYFEGEDVIRILSARIFYRNLDTTTLTDLIDSEGKLIPEDPQPEVPGVGVYSVPLQGAYNPPSYAQSQYDQYYQQYHLRHHSISSSNRMTMSSVETTRVGCVTACCGSCVF
uniref:Uncharacterized protein n=1 Tax=Tanacetum cinerariifolium TaxID=118510 RepID=A0A6L2JAB7_TANCI|nr:hypothetical protein [Tanacetum cinerariifolium]